jgi:SAM-dependent methyltransferase
MPTSMIRAFGRKLKRLLFPVYLSPVTYWRNRYGRFEESLIAPGCVELDESANEVDYEAKWTHIEAAVRRAGEPRGKALLDAGCGLGIFTRRFLALGYTVSAVDFAENAVAGARRRIGDSVTWHVATLGEFSPGRTFDLVVCIDVLFHITDDALHRQAVANLAGLTAPGGTLVIQDHLVPEADTLAKYSPRESHVRWRSLARYRALLEPEWTLIQHDHYDLPMEKDTKDLLTFRRQGPDR